MDAQIWRWNTATMARRLTLCFPTLSEFRQELEQNIICGGAFVETTDCYELREKVDVELDLPFCSKSVTLEAEVVSCVGPDVTRAGGRAGVAVQFAESVPMIRQLLSSMAGTDPPLELKKRREQREAPVRYQPRSHVRLPTVVETSSARQAAHTVNMSLSGALIEIDAEPVPVGEQITLTFPHPETREALQFSGRVARHAKSAEQKNQIGVHFDFDPSDDTPTRRMLDLLLKAAHSRLLGRVTGELRVLGTANLLQMLSSSSEQGTLLLRQGARTGRVLFDGGMLRYTSVGGATGEKALARLLEWTEGEFEYTPSIDVDAPQGARMQIDAALLVATQHVDELGRLDLSHFPGEATVLRVPQSDAWIDLDKVADSVLEAISDGIVIGELLDTLSEFDDEIYQALGTLRELGLIRTADAGTR
jgi:Tfp pilus assembly protein PilZ